MDKRCACVGEDNKCWGESNKRFRPNIYYEKDCTAKHYSLMKIPNNNNQFIYLKTAVVLQYFLAEFQKQVV